MDYRISILPNQSGDPEHPPAEFPFVIFIRCLANVLSSGWAFAKTIEEARKTQDDLKARLS